jgi:hypothetical protein
VQEEEKRHYIDILFQIYDLAINEQKMSFEDCEEMDILAYIDFLDYLLNRKQVNSPDDIEDY